jgi:BRCT domain type II-containing protein
MKTNKTNPKKFQKTKELQVKFFKEESLFDHINYDSLLLFREMMADRFRDYESEEE